jgi:glycosyltransferase involved in cell wall biosynthesis
MGLLLTGSRPRSRPPEAADSRSTPALVHDYLLVMRGAERSFAAMADCWPQSPIYTLLYDRRGTGGQFDGRDVHTSYLQRLGVGQSGFRRLLPLFPRAVESLDLQQHDLVISSSSAFAHGVRKHPDAVHVCYCYTPFRYAWHEWSRGIEEAPRALRPALRETLRHVRRWDLAASRRVDHYIAISEFTRQRIASFWERDSSVIYPPVETERFYSAEPEDYFLVTAELVRHKLVDHACEAARRAAVPLKVVGHGPELQRLQAHYGETVDFLGRVDDRQLADLYARARAVVVANVEEFGIVAVEAQAAGRPVITSGEGGARETVIDGMTGVHVPLGDVDGFAEAMRHTNFDAFSPEVIQAHAERFSVDAFKERLTAEVERIASLGRHAARPLARTF